MAYNETTYKASQKYKESNIKRIPLDVQRAFFEELQAAAADLGESVNGYIKKAIQAQLDRDAQELERIRAERAEQERLAAENTIDVPVDEYL